MHIDAPLTAGSWQPVAPTSSPGIGRDDLTGLAALTPALWQVMGQVLPFYLEAAGDMLSVKDAASGRYLYASASFAGFVGCDRAELTGTTDADRFDATTASALRAADQTAQTKAEGLHSEHGFEWRGERRNFSVFRMLLAAGPQAPRWLISVWRDVTPERNRQEQLRSALEQIEQQQLANETLRRELTDQALRDPASGLHRKNHFEDQLRRELDLSTREHREFSIVFIEIDPDTPAVAALGEPGQQKVLEALGRLLRSGTRAMDASCRYDARRFAVLLSGVGLATGHARMEGLRRKCSTHIVVHQGQELNFSVSVGVASFPHTTADRDGLLASCEAALSDARRRGGNHVSLAAISLANASGA